MTPDERSTIEDHIRDRNGRYPNPTPERGWLAAERVELKKESLLVWFFPEEGEQRVKLVRPVERLFRRFLSLDEACEDDIRQFVTNYGTLNVFEHPGLQSFGPSDRKTQPSVVFCSVYKYFAKVMRAIIMLSDSLHDGQRGRESDWLTLGEYPDIMGKVLAKKVWAGYHFALDGEKLWLQLAADHRDKRLALPTSLANGKAHLGVILDFLLELADVRLHFEWQTSKKHSPRPRWFYANDSLFRFLVLALCRVVATQPTLVNCSECGFEYPPNRAPRTSKTKVYKNYCPGCVKKGLPQLNAKLAHIERLRDPNYVPRQYRKKRIKNPDVKTS